MHGAARRCIICAMRSPSKKKDHRNVMAVFSLRTFVGRDLLAGVLDEMTRKNRARGRTPLVGWGVVE